MQSAGASTWNSMQESSKPLTTLLLVSYVKGPWRLLTFLMSSRHVISGDSPPWTHRNCWFKRAARGRQSNVSIHASYTRSEYLIRPGKMRGRGRKRGKNWINLPICTTKTAQAESSSFFFFFYLFFSFFFLKGESFMHPNLHDIRSIKQSFDQPKCW